MILMAFCSELATNPILHKSNYHLKVYKLPVKGMISNIVHSIPFYPLIKLGI